MPRNLCFVLLLVASFAVNAAGDSHIDWLDWDAAAFKLAKNEQKPILLNLEAVWCHWCHVMDQKTYSDPVVAAIIKEKFVAIKVDHDARPDLANRYRDYGWPATIFLDSTGQDLVKRAGYIKPENFARLLQAVAADPTPERQSRAEAAGNFAAKPALPESILNELKRRHVDLYDSELGGLKSNQKTLDRDHVEFALMQSATDPIELEIAQKTIQASFALQDPEWGGIYQYSTFGDWQHPHFEKIMASQAGFMRIYALAYQQFGDSAYLDNGEKIANYLFNFLTSPNGQFYTSQDADLIQGEKGTSYFALPDEERRELGMPRIDKNVYARENGLAIEALAMLYEASGNPLYLARAERAARAMIESHQRQSGGFAHSSTEVEADYLGDSLFMAAALLQLHKVSGDQYWLSQAERCARFIVDNFSAEGAGYLSGRATPGLPVQPVRHLDENIKATRALNLIAQYLGDEKLREAAEHGMRYLATSSVAYSRIEDSGILIAATEMAMSAPHFTIVGGKSDKAADNLFAIGRAQAGWYKRLEWWDKSEGLLKNSDVTYPSFDRAAGFVCVDRLCSAPAFTTEQYSKMIKRLMQTTE